MKICQISHTFWGKIFSLENVYSGKLYGVYVKYSPLYQDLLVDDWKALLQKPHISWIVTIFKVSHILSIFSFTLYHRKVTHKIVKLLFFILISFRTLSPIQDPSKIIFVTHLVHKIYTNLRTLLTSVFANSYFIRFSYYIRCLLNNIY